MTVDKAIKIFVSHSSEDREEILVYLMHELTIIVRDSYEVGRDGLTNPQRVRRINEVQHCVSAYLYALMSSNSQRYPDDVLIRIILEHPDDKELEEQLSRAFARSTTDRVSVA